MRFVYTLLSALAATSVLAMNHVVYSVKCKQERANKNISKCFYNSYNYETTKEGVALYKKNFHSTLCQNFYDSTKYKNVLPTCYSSFNPGEKVIEWSSNSYAYGEGLLLFTTFKNNGTTNECPMAKVIRKERSNDDLLKAAETTMNNSKYNACIEPSRKAMKYITLGFENLSDVGDNYVAKYYKIYKTLSNGKNPTLSVSKDERCGFDHDMTACPNSKCCSKYGYCGTTNAHCAKSKCQIVFGKCNKN
ncbi:carbohydrate-binding module family 18 protein [Piromyces sp. E2]|nr:carbohydrate-binding module family 18 protein [Piromyces sp. E2]|eukprot:OUM62910.1 carbohydrate-binding module family 18 protein [Piromyces sp. E2]